MSLLKDRIIVITGAGRGLGRAFAEDCCRQGAEVVIAEKNIEWGQQCELELRNAGHTATFFPVDIADPDSVKRLSTDLSKTCKKIDGLVNNAGLATGIGGKTFEEIDLETWDLVMRINVRGTWLMVKALASQLRRSDSGRVVNLTSDTALWGATKLLHYVSSKGAVIAMTRSLARELGPDSITVNAVAPGLVRGESTDYVPQERHDLYESGRAIPRAQYPEDVVGAVSFLLSEQAGFITGQVLPVNGGFVFN